MKTNAKPVVGQTSPRYPNTSTPSLTSQDIQEVNDILETASRLVSGRSRRAASGITRFRRWGGL